MVDLAARRAHAAEVIARWMKGIVPMNERVEVPTEPIRVASKRVAVSRHDHVGHLVYGDQRIECESCGQAWRLERNRSGQPVAWKALQWHPSRSVLEETLLRGRPISSFDPDEDVA